MRKTQMFQVIFFSDSLDNSMTNTNHFRILGETLLLIRGKEATGIDHHNDMINELFLINVKTLRPVQALLNVKSARNKVNYHGYIPGIEEINDSLSMITSLFKPLLEAIKKEIERK